ncbi:MAG TPA: GTP diphosphokinase [Gammaproteobacteria bacterium]|nr:GTP diphosphokinase [Gammaproteobacteria bacterium]
MNLEKPLHQKHPQTERFQRALVLCGACGEISEPLPTGMEVVEILAQVLEDEAALIATLLADRRCQESISVEVVEAEFGSTVAGLLANVRLLNNFRPCHETTLSRPLQAERLRRLVLALVDDVRAVLIKLAYRLARLRLLSGESAELQHCIAQETLDVFAPLANRLGLAQIKWELEDLSFRYLEPETYKQIAKALEERRVDRERYVDTFKQALSEFLTEVKIEASVSGRPKHIYSISRKMQQKDLGLDELFDIHAVRILVDSVADCYASLGIIHTQWKTIPKEFDDYIANPKPNGYQSLHTVIIGPDSKPVEIQIRTREMHEFAEHGVAAHWRYKEGGGGDETLNEVIASLRRLVDDTSGDAALLADFKSEAFPDRVYVLTPAGDVIDLPKGATPLDFAYHIHTQVGHRCRGAKVNGRIVTLTTPLENAQQVEILTAGESRPSRDWMNPGSDFLVSAGSRAKVRHWFHTQDREENLEAGQRILEQSAKRFDSKLAPVEDLIQRFKQDSAEHLYIAIGRGDIRQSQLDALFQVEPDVDELIVTKTADKKPKQAKTSAEVLGVKNLLTRIAKCCQPIPGDAVIGYITLGQGVTIHRKDCSNIQSLSEEKLLRLIEIDWGETESQYPVWLEVTAYDRTGLLKDITQIVADSKSNVTRLDTSTNVESGQVLLKLRTQISDQEHLASLIQSIGQIRNVFSVKRFDL